ncbi:MAG: class I SAM-dependent methyltransferase [Candidatus Peribacteria bacterium]|nr:class I SAM-dependent methyltransferase [Candidatus Peribacteria bacterium]
MAQHFATNYRYVGVDISQGLLAYAKKECPKGKFICEEMTEFVVRQKQEKFDIIIGTSSFQHIPSARERLFLMKHFYRLLNYDGLLVFTNWSLSQRFLKRYRKEVFGAFVKYVFRGGRGSPRDIFVPRTNKEKTFTRFYHLFSLKELKKLVISSGLTLEQLTYLDEKGTTT